MKEKLIICLITGAFSLVANAIPIAPFLDPGLARDADDARASLAGPIRPAWDVGAVDSVPMGVQRGVISVGMSLPILSSSKNYQLDPSQDLQVRDVVNNPANPPDSPGNHMGRKQDPDSVSVPDANGTGLLLAAALSVMLLLRRAFPSVSCDCTNACRC